MRGSMASYKRDETDLGIGITRFAQLAYCLDQQTPAAVLQCPLQLREHLLCLFPYFAEFGKEFGA
jgi:hypothetical protein